MSSPLWLSIEPDRGSVRIMLSEPAGGTSLKARLPWPPHHHRALPMLLEALSAWYRLPLHAVLDADASAVRDDPEAWAIYAGDLPGLEVTIEWIARPPARRRKDRFLGSMGDFSSGRRLLTFAATGQR